MLGRMPGMAKVAAREDVTMRVVGGTGAQADIRLLLDETTDARRLSLSRAMSIVPGLTLRDTIRTELIEPRAAIDDAGTLPEAFREVAGLDCAAARAAPLLANRTAFRCRIPASGPPVEVVLLSAPSIRVTPPRAPGSGATESRRRASQAFCELHLLAECGEGAKESPIGASVQAAGAAVLAVADSIVARLPAFVATGDAYARALGAAVGSEPVRATRVDLAGARTPHDALVAIGCNVASHWFGNERGAREQTAPESVHQMRVALRRARTLVRLFPRWRDEAWHTRVEPGIKWLGGLLGAARDLDVFVDSTLPALAAADGDASRWAPVQAKADARRQEAHAQLQEALRSRRHAELSLAWLEWLMAQRFSDGPPKHARRSLASYAGKRVKRYYTRLTAPPALTSLDAAGRHRRRIAAKRLRYALEFFQALTASRTRGKVTQRLSLIQETLGEGSDAATALRFIEALDVTPYQQGFARGWCEAVNRGTARVAERLLGKLRRPVLRDR
ncbi:hypothetical protein Busp01_20870 [Trinickia caryophylli]|nr:CHAD domain-containing protein [Trinickia caryophylli]GLU32245.1 hypothetical protein Busp01_20870 [Trinickia caryophylli]